MIGSGMIGGDPEDHSILQRLSGGMTLIGVVRPTGQEAVLRLTKRGVVTWSWGDGKDAGCMMVRRAADGKPPPYPHGSGMRA